MSILAVEMTNWTHSLQNNILEQQMTECVAETQANLKEIVELIKTPSLSPIQIMTLEALIVLSVHNLDVTKNLESININSTNEFAF